MAALRRPIAGALTFVLGALAATTGGAVARAAPDLARPVDESPNVRAAADAFVTAWRAGDAAAIAALAARPVPDPMLVAHSLLERHRAVALDRAPPTAETTPWLEAARAWAAAVGEAPAAEGVAGYVARYGAFGPEDLRREARLTEAVRLSLRAETGEVGPDEALAALRARADDVARGHATVRAWYVRYQEGRMQQALRRPEAARAAFRDAVALADALPRPRGVTLALQAAAGVAMELGDLADAIASQRRGAELLRRIGRPADAATAGVDLATTLRLAGRPEEARVVAARAAEDARAAGDARLGAAATLADAAAVLALGDRATADHLAAAAEASFTRASSPRDVCAAALLRAQSALDRDRLADAQRHLERALAAVASGPDADFRAAVRASLGVVARRLGRTAEARAALEASVADAAATGNPAALAGAEQALATFLLEQGDASPATDARFERVAEARARAGDRAGEARGWLGVAACAARRGAGERADASLARAAVAAAASRLPEIEADVEAAKGERAAADGRPAEALEALDRALARLAGRPGLGLRRAGVEVARAHALRALGRAEAALEAALAACRARLDARDGLVGEDAPALLRRTRDAGDLAVALALGALAAGVPPGRVARAALDAAEAGRALSLLEGVVHRDALLAAHVPAALREGEATARAALDAARRRRLDAAATPAPDDDAAADRALAEAYRAHAEAADRVGREARAVAATVFPHPADADAVAATLAPDEAAIVLHVGAERATAVVVRPGRTAAPVLCDLGPGRPLVEAADAWRRAASAPGSDDRALASALHARVVAPMRAALAGARRWVVAPDAVVATAPFAAMLDATGPTPRRLVEDVEVVLVPSLTFFAAQRADRTPPGTGVLALGGPTFRADGPDALPPLPGARAEAEAVAAAWPADDRNVLVGSDATEARLRAALADGRRRALVHVATHAFADAGFPRLTHLALAGDDAWDLDEIQATPVRADVVVLSACATATGTTLEGEGVVGLARSFLLAGARRVVASAWAVDDGATRPLMERFAAGLASGDGAAAALRAAQRAALATGGPGAHPSRWAAFAVWGAP